jgi:hypothetical protein
MLVRLEIKPFGSVTFGFFLLCSMRLVFYGTECHYLFRCCDRGKLQVVINLNRRAHTSVARPDLRLSRKVLNGLVDDTNLRVPGGVFERAVGCETVRRACRARNVPQPASG